MNQKHLCLILFSITIIFFNPSAGIAKNIGVMWVGKSGMTRSVIEGFKEEISKIAPNINIEYQKELENMAIAEKVFNRFNKEKDAIVFLRSSGAKFLGKQKLAVPGFIGGCNHPAEFGIVKKIDAPPHKNITGVTYYTPVAWQFILYLKIIPDIKSICLLLEQGHPGTAIDRKYTKIFCQKSQIKYFEAVCSNKVDLVQKVEEFKDTVDVFVIGSEALCMDNAKIIVDTAGKVPVVAYSKKAVENGALICYSPSDQKLGRLLATSVHEVLNEGQKVEKVLLKLDPKPRVAINETTAKKLGLNIPPSILKKALIIK